jgi:maltooligosyltrehalose synthase
MYTLYKMLALRNKHSEVLLRGQYIPVEVTGPKHHHLIVSNKSKKLIPYVDPNFLSGLYSRA